MKYVIYMRLLWKSVTISWQSLLLENVELAKFPFPIMSCLEKISRHFNSGWTCEHKFNRFSLQSCSCFLLKEWHDTEGFWEVEKGIKHFFFFCFFFLEPHLWHMEVPRLESKSKLQLPAYTTATVMWNPSCVYNLHHNSL